MSRRRRRTGPPQCRICHRPIRWFKSPVTSGWRTFNLAPVDPRTVHAAAYPVEAQRAWRAQDLINELMGRWSIGRDEAAEHVAAMPWHTLHACPTPDSDTESTAP